MPEVPAGGAQIDVNGGDNRYDPLILNGAPAPPLPELCAQIHAKVNAFLNRPTTDERVLAVQKRCRESLDVIEEALHTYSYVRTHMFSSQAVVKSALANQDIS